MKYHLRFLLTQVALFITCLAFSQINGKYNGEKEDFKQMAKRTLLVEIIEEDAATIKYLSKKESRAAELAEYKAFIADYNLMIKTVVPKYWTYNTKVEYKTTSEIDEIRKLNNDNYVVLEYFEQADSDINTRTRSGLIVPALRYTRIERKNKTPDYKICLPSSFIREGKKYLEADFRVALLGMQANIKWVIKNDKKMQYQDFTEEESAKNCSKLKEKTLIIEKKNLYEKTSESEAKTAYGSNIEWVTADQLNQAMVEKTPGKAALFAIPYGIANGGIGPISTANLVFFKIIVDCESGEVLWSNNPGSFPIGKNVGHFMIEKEFKNAGSCKN